MDCFCFKRNNKLKKKSISKIHGACSSTNLTSSSLYYERIFGTYIFIIRGIIRTLEYSKVWQYLNPCKIFFNVFQKLVFAKLSFLDHFRCLAGFYICLCTYKCYLACTVILGSASGTFWHIQALLKNMLMHIQNLLCCWHIQNPGILLSQSIFRLYGIFIILF